MKIAVLGAAGYAGGELLRLLLQHPEVTECVATSRSQGGKPIGEVHPALAAVTDARFSGATPGEVHDGLPIGDHGRAWRMLYLSPELVVDLLADIAEDAPTRDDEVQDLADRSIVVLQRDEPPRAASRRRTGRAGIE